MTINLQDPALINPSMEDNVLMPPPREPPMGRMNHGSRIVQHTLRDTYDTDHSQDQWETYGGWRQTINNSSIHQLKQLKMNQSKQNNMEYQEKRREKKKQKLILKRRKLKEEKQLNQQTPPRDWNREDAERALNFEKAYNSHKGDIQIKLEFPDEPHTPESMKALHPNLNQVYPLDSYVKRFCYVTLRPGADVEKVLADLNSQPLPEFNGKCPTATLCSNESANVVPEDIDPYTLFIGNIPSHIKIQFFKDAFPNKRRMDSAISRKVKNTRYVFIRFRTLNESIEAFKKALNFKFDSLDLIIRFKRFKVRRNNSSCSSANDDEEKFQFRPEFVPGPTESDFDPEGNVQCDESDSLFDPDEYDFDEIYPAPRDAGYPLMKFITTDDEENIVKGFDLEKNLPVIPDDLASNNVTESLHDLDSPF